MTAHAVPPPPLTVSLTVAGEPVPKQRARRGTRGRWYTPPETRRYENLVRACALIAARRERWPWPPPTGPMRVTLRVVFANERRRDLDNVAKTVLDALRGVLYRDDSQVVTLLVTRELDRNAPGVQLVLQRESESG